MSTAGCRRSNCVNTIPSSLASERLCLDHFLDEAVARVSVALEQSRREQPIDASGVEQLLADSLAIVSNLEEDTAGPDPEKRERMLDLLLSLANLHEYVAQYSMRLNRLA